MSLSTGVKCFRLIVSGSCKNHVASVCDKTNGSNVMVEVCFVFLLLSLARDRDPVTTKETTSRVRWDGLRILLEAVGRRKPEVTTYDDCWASRRRSSVLNCCSFRIKYQHRHKHIENWKLITCKKTYIKSDADRHCDRWKTTVKGKTFDKLSTSKR